MSFPNDLILRCDELLRRVAHSTGYNTESELNQTRRFYNSYVIEVWV
jgi:hypothetical protein